MMNRLSAAAAAAALCVGVACDEADSNQVTAVDAYMAIVDAYSTAEFRALGLNAPTVSPVRPGPYHQQAPSALFEELQRRGVTLAATAAPLCTGDVRLAFGPATLQSDGVYQIDVDVGIMLANDFGDIEHLRFRVDCRSGICLPTSEDIDRASIGGGC